MVAEAPPATYAAAQLAQARRSRLRAPRVRPGDDPQIDIFTIAWSVKYERAVERSSMVEVEGVLIPLIGIDDLVETRRTGRPLDAVDLETLEEIKRLRG